MNASFSGRASARLRSRFVSAAAAATAAVATSPTTAAVDLSLVPVESTYQVGDVVEFRLVASSDSKASQFSAAMLAVFAWDVGSMGLLGVDQAGATPILGATFPTIYAPNESSLPADGDGALQVLAQLGNPMPITPDGTLITTFRFTALAPEPDAFMTLLPELLGVETVVFDGVIPNLDVTGLLGGASVTIVPAPASLSILLCAGLARRRRRAVVRLDDSNESRVHARGRCA